MLEWTDAIINEVLEPITFILAYPTVQDFEICALGKNIIVVFWVIRNHVVWQMGTVFLEAYTAFLYPGGGGCIFLHISDRHLLSYKSVVPTCHIPQNDNMILLCWSLQTF